MRKIAPGARIVCRDAEWLVQQVVTVEHNDALLKVTGISECVQGKEFCFLHQVEHPDRPKRRQRHQLRVLWPEETDLVTDQSSGYVHSLLFLEAQLRQTTLDPDCLYVGHRGAMDTLPYQLLPAVQALSNPRQRILIADNVGLGKTLECGILVSELIRRGRGRRILTITTKSMMEQFQQEFWHRFTIPLRRLDSQEIRKIRAQLPGNHNPFNYYDRSIISIDTLKQDREYRRFLEQARWDIIIIDEAHNVARRSRGESASLRAKLAERLSSRSDTLILLSATPHDGRPESFASLMNMLDPTALLQARFAHANEREYTKDDIRQLYIRRFKKDVLNDLKTHIPERRVVPVEADASGKEEQVFEALAQIHFQTGSKGGALFKTTVLKAILSSPIAGLETVENRINTLEKSLKERCKEAEKSKKQPSKVTEEDIHQDLSALTSLQAKLKAIAPTDFAKYQALIRLIQQELQWRGKDPEDRLVIFTGRLATLNFLREHLPSALGLPKTAIAALDGGLGDTEQMAIVRQFGQRQEPVRILIATEVASEGLNLHYLSHKLIHFDIPWSLMTLQQRNGRIDRYGQTRTPEIRYLLTRSQVAGMDEVERIIQVLLRKDEQAMLNIGDPSVFMGVFDPEAEEQIIEQVITDGTKANDFERMLDNNAQGKGEEDNDFLAWFLGEDVEDEEETAPSQVFEPRYAQFPSLFTSDFDYAAASLQNLEKVPPNLRINEGNDRLIELQFPQELQSRYERLPKELQRQETELMQLCDNPERIMREIDQARAQNTWSRVEYLWPLHPMMEWLNDRNLFRFGRQEAPAIAVSEGLKPQEVVFLFFASFPNQSGAPILTRWVSVCFEQGQYAHTESLEVTLERTQLGRKPLANRRDVHPEPLMDLRSPAVVQAKQYLQQERQQFQATLDPQLQEQLERLETLKSRHYEQLTLNLQDAEQSTSKQQQRQEAEKQRIERAFSDHRRWVKLSMTMEAEPFIKLVAVLVCDA
ncbi:MAG: hypothetical protein RLZZ568_1990 [Cyanobacteriota bacterium]